MSRERVWPAPAKLNLFLHITGRRADGYHLLQTVYQFLDHGDELQFEVRRDGQIQRAEGPESVPEASDLSLRAARLLKEKSGSPCSRGWGVAAPMQPPPSWPWIPCGRPPSGLSVWRP